MTFKAKLPDDTVNVSESNMGLYGLRVIGGFACVLVAVYILLAVFSDYLVRLIPPETENKLYSHFDMASHFDGEKAADKYQHRAKALLDNIPVNIRPEGYDLSVIVVEDKDVNAFAMPGGIILLTTALMEEVENDHGLTFVIGHEIGHFHGRDHLEGISRQILFQVMAALVLGQSSADISSLESVLNLSVDSHYSRRDESEADEWGVETLMATYGHAGGATDFLQEIMDEDEEIKWAEMFSSHPLSEKRMRAINAYIELNDYPINNEN